MNIDDLVEAGFGNIQVIEQMYEEFLANPDKVDPSWRNVFEKFDKLKPAEILTRRSIPSLTPPEQPEEAKGASVIYYPNLVIEGPTDLRIYGLINAYRSYGHLMARVNPLATGKIEEPRELNLETLGFKKEELSRDFPTLGLLSKDYAPLLEIIHSLKEIYCKNIGIEYMGLQRPEMEQWIQEKFEKKGGKQLSIDQKQSILQHLNKSELFEIFLHTKYVGQKRFSLEGGETLIPILGTILENGIKSNLEALVIGMAHRGRLNVLSNILNKSYSDIFSEFEEHYIPESIEGTGDVKYHKGFSSEITTPDGKKVSVILSPNPSHLEAVDPVVEGYARALQTKKGGGEKVLKTTVPVLVHGDAAIAGQGVVYETLQLYALDGYKTGGTIHIVVNNQIGFTTLPKEGRSTRYCTDIARAFSAPVFHVNAEDPEGCVYVANLALELRNIFHCDVFIDMNCYRKYGHNETDEPAYTQPIEYQLIRKKKSIRELYRDDLIQQGVLEKYMAESLEAEFKKGLQQAQQFMKMPKEKPTAKAAPYSAEASRQEDIFASVPTGVPKGTIIEIEQNFYNLPPDFSPHKKLESLIKERKQMIRKDDASAKPLDWGTGELLAYATLLWEGTSVRISGQDCQRGTFSHRHAIVKDQVNDTTYIPLQYLKEKQGRFDVINSPLSEFAVLGFEYGYSLAYPETLVIWEAQFGDFSNGGQVIIDQFIATAEQKWAQKFGLVMFLPHGYEGQGPEHSSGRIERFLALCGENNMQVVNPSTPAQLFHLLRRQMLRPWKKPLIVFTPKGLLRHPACVSPIEDFTHGSFQEILDDPKPAERTDKLVLCAGRIYYDLIAEREKHQAKDVTFVRVEQFYPLHKEKIKKILDKYKDAKEIIWLQEEPRNMGAADFILLQLQEISGKMIRYIGRERSAASAVGTYVLHKKQHAEIIHDLFGKDQLAINLASQIQA